MKGADFSWKSVLLYLDCDQFVLFSADGSDWTTYNDPDFIPVFFNEDLAAMFPDETKRQEAVSLCNNGATSDESPADRKECYFDFKVHVYEL